MGASRRIKYKRTILSKITGKSDGCTNSPDLNFYECCAEHDYYYGKDSDVPRYMADLILAYCIYKKGHWFLSVVYFMAVRRHGKKHYEACEDNS